jgi:DUF4097 and DUF4098 domain-containing protein YvlB
MVWRSSRAPTAAGIGLAAAFLCLQASCGDALGPDEVVRSEPFEFLQDATGRTGFQVIGVNGSITVIAAVQGEAFLVSGVRQVRGCSREQADSYFEDLEVEVTETAQNIVVRTLQPQNTSPCTLEVDYELTVPARLAGEVIDVNGEITVTGLDQGLSVILVNGPVTLADVEHQTTVRLTNGSITAGLVPAGTDRIDLLTVNGSIDLEIPASTGAELTATVTNGTISIANLTVSNQVSSGTSVTGTLGTGEGEVVVRTTNGSSALTGV